MNDQPGKQALIIIDRDEATPVGVAQIPLAESRDLLPVGFRIAIARNEAALEFSNRAGKENNDGRQTLLPVDDVEKVPRASGAGLRFEEEMPEIIIFGIGLLAKVLEEALPVSFSPGIGAMIRGHLVSEGRGKKACNRRFGRRL